MVNLNTDKLCAKFEGFPTCRECAHEKACEQRAAANHDMLVNCYGPVEGEIIKVESEDTPRITGSGMLVTMRVDRFDGYTIQEDMRERGLKYTRLRFIDEMQYQINPPLRDEQPEPQEEPRFKTLW